METWKRGNEVVVGGLGLGLEKRAKLVGDVEQEMRVFARVFLHVPRQGADSAVKRGRNAHRQSASWNSLLAVTPQNRLSR